MLKEIMDFRISDSDLCAYLMTEGYDISYVEVVKDRKNNSKLKAFIHFMGYKEELINIQTKFNNNEVTVYPKEFSKMRKKLNMIIKSELLRYELNNV